jgi:F0F1-type ATP synthase membrane subunit b/b'
VKRSPRFFPWIHWQAVSCCGVFLLLIAAPAIAQEATTGPENSQTGWIFRWIIFAIVVVCLVYAFAKAVPSFRTTSEEIAQRIAEGARRREAAERQRREIQAKLAGIDTEVTKFRDEAKRSMETEAARLKALARHEAEIIERAAQAEILAAQRAAALEMKALAARLAVERAAVVLTEQITPEAQASLFRTFVAELDRSAN